MSEFTEYRRLGSAWARPVTAYDCTGEGIERLESIGVSISPADLDAGSPRIGDMICMNPSNYADQWLVAHDYFQENFEHIASGSDVLHTGSQIGVRRGSLDSVNSERSYRGLRFEFSGSSDDFIEISTSGVRTLFGANSQMTDDAYTRSLEDAIRDYISRVDAGEILSTSTYEKFRELLS